MDSIDRTSERHDRADEAPRIAALGDLGDFQIAEGYPDPRGWDVVGANGTKVGKVHDLIVDTGEMRTRYLDVSLDKDAVGGTDDRDVLIPVGAAQVDDSNDQVRLGSLDGAELASLPAFEHGEITRDYETSLLSRMPSKPDAADTRSAEGSDYYATHHFDDNRFFGNRKSETANTASTGDSANEARMTRSEEELEVNKKQVKAGEVGLHKHVETEHVSKPVTVQREEVTIERRPLRAGQSAGQSVSTTIDGDTEIHIPITEEQLAVEKRVVAKEEVVVKKHMVTENQTVEGDVRKERIDIDKSGRANDADEEARGRS